MKALLSFPSARKACAALVAVLAVIENMFALPVWCILAVRSRLADALENATGGSGHE
jgi:hypothetical protein